MKKTALIVGRFQPFHFGHQKLMEWAANDVSDLVIAIGSSQESHTLQNPFTASERRRMIEESLKTRLRYEITEVSDINDDGRWVGHVEKNCPDFDVVYTNGEKERKLFEEEGYNVETTPMFREHYYSGTEIRNRMVTGDNWRDLVPYGTIRVIEEVDGVGRLQRLYKTYNL